jgi:lycopene beta-cyclase
LKEQPKIIDAQQIHWPLILVGAGLASAVIVQRLSRLSSPPKILILEASNIPFGEHTWSFHLADLTAFDLKWMENLIAHRWAGQSVRFKAFRRDLTSGYASLTSESVAKALARNATLTLVTNSTITRIATNHIMLANGKRLTADCIIDARGFRPSEAMAIGHQKFVGLEIETAVPHGLINPIIMDASVDQRDGYRFIYVLPFSPTRMLIEDTRYSDDDVLNLQALTRDISTYAGEQNWQIARTVRQEHGVLPIALAHDFERFWDEQPSDIPQVGMRAGLFHPTTGYSLPEAVRIANLIANAWPIGSLALAQHIREHALSRWRQQRFYRFLNRMLFRAAIPNRRHLVLQRFYKLPQPLIERFYAGQSHVRDMIRILTGRPPVPIIRALSCLRETALLKEKNK